MGSRADKEDWFSSTLGLCQTPIECGVPLNGRFISGRIFWAWLGIRCKRNDKAQDTS